MGFMKRFAEQVSVDIGHGGEITGAEIREAQKRLCKKDEKEIIKALHHGSLECSDHEGEVLTLKTYGGLFCGDPVCKKAWKEREDFLDNI